jgi:hypothetical protein
LGAKKFTFYGAFCHLRAIRFIARLHSARIAVYAAAVLLAPLLTIGSIALFAAATIIFGLPNPFLERRLAELGLT